VPGMLDEHAQNLDGFAGERHARVAAPEGMSRNV
jgi:hypothetical protein